MGQPPRMIIYTVLQEDAEKCCDIRHILKGKLQLTDRQISRLKFRQDGINLNGRKARVTEKVAVGDRLELCIADQVGNKNTQVRQSVREKEDAERSKGKMQDAERPEGQMQTGLSTDCSPVRTDAEAVSILYEDEDLLILNKPAGMAVHPSRGHHGDTLADAAEAYLKSSSLMEMNAGHRSSTGRGSIDSASSTSVPGSENKSKKNDTISIHAVGRLDKDTSGIVVFAKNAIAAQRLQKDGIHKEYVALVDGKAGEPGTEQTICLPIEKDPAALNKMRIAAPGCGRKAVTHAQVLKVFHFSEENVTISLVRFTLETGRTHQIRVHMAAIGHPLLADPIYGKQDRQPGSLHRTALHCGKALLYQPFRGNKIEVRASLSADMGKFICESERKEE